jgi:hypothetical protein
MNDAPVPTAERRTCPSCDRAVERCACCEREDCPTITCYRCMVLELRQFLPHPHLHGG